MISKFLVGQEVSGYTTKDHIFEGFVFRNNEGKKVVRDEDGKWLYLSELKKIKQVGRRLNEEYEEAITNVTKKLSADKVASKESEFDSIAKDIATAAGVSESDSNREDAEKFAHEQLVGLKAEKDASITGNKAAMEKAKEDLKDMEKDLEEQAEDALKESQFSKNKRLFEDFKRRKALREAFNETEDFDYSNIDETPGFDDSFDEDYHDDLLESGPDDYFNDTVDDEFEVELDSYEALGGDYTDEYLLEALAKKFGGDAELALKESNGDKIDAVIHLANQVRKLREASAKMTCFQLSKRLEAAIKDPTVNLENLENFIFNVGRTANSEQGIVIDDEGIGPIGQRLSTSEQVAKFLIAACNHTSNPKAAMAFCKKYANRIGAKIAGGIRVGNANTVLDKFDLISYFSKLSY